ncbi:hypothetical protein PC9H_011815 [Pleurotus ostreatus]|uniref:Meiotically up-regulated gene 152 protein n=1 Tax=Pleurotus ostreatus TaxID=5322 RepID=A0A8H6ZLR6_PLEOS|nr:uncharacterized protein PC9H_011815 [Pleurotus ostreatus]KAF7421293.1 hypothetical protein PC9H_011815 [Pleurotus ostreatus]
MSTNTGAPADPGKNGMPTLTVTACKATMPPPATSTFSFKAPFPVASPGAMLKPRRVSLALPSSPRLVPDSAWNFRDDTGIDAHRTGHSNPGQGYESDTDVLLPEKRGKMRRIASDGDDFTLGSTMGASGSAESAAGPSSEKKQRKKWTTEETQMLVDGCNKHGVGNWKTILSDKSLKFDSRSPVDLKDRYALIFHSFATTLTEFIHLSSFRTYFPDAYRLHYPNAKTHLSSKIRRSTLPDGKPLFEKTRSKKRRPFTEAEDKALKEGYEKHGTVWATIVKDPVFQDQGRRSTDLRDRFRNAFPDLYQAAGYKPRAASTKKKEKDVATSILSSAGATGITADDVETIVDPAGTITAQNIWRRPAIPLPMRAATDDQIPESGPVRRRRRALFRGGTKSVPQSATVSEDEDEGTLGSAIEEDETCVLKPPLRRAKRPTFSTGSDYTTSEKRRARASSASAAMTFATVDNDEIEMDLDISIPAPSGKDASMDASASRSSHHASSSPSDLDIDDSLSASHSHSGLDTPVHGHATWSPTSSHLSSDLLSQTHTPAMGISSPTSRRMDARNPSDGNSMIGKSPWGTADWLVSSNPRLEPTNSMGGFSGTSNSNASSASVNDLDLDVDESFSPASPFSFNHLNHGVMDRYDLFPASTSLHGHSMSHSISHASSPQHFGQHAQLHSFGMHSLYNSSMDERQDDFASVCSEIGFGDRDTHSTFSDDLSGYAHTGFRGFTHHSNYAGDLIFGARTHQPQQPYYGMGSALGLGLGGPFGASAGVGVNSGFGMPSNNTMDMAAEGLGGIGLGLDLDGMSPSPATAIHSLQLHGSSLPGIDEIELTNITLDDRAQPEEPDQTMEDAANPKDTMKLESANTSAISTGSQYDLTSIDDLIDLSQHEDPSLNTTPPGTPVMSSRPSSLYHRALSGFSGQSLHGRSISVPPSQVRSVSRPETAQPHAHSEPELSVLRSVPFFSSLSQDSTKRIPSADLSTARPPSAFAPSFAFGMLTSGGPSHPNTQDHDLPFLDLHYKTSSNPSGTGDAMDHSPGSKPASEGYYRQGQALDLAQSAATSAALKTLGIPASLRRHIPMPPPKCTVIPSSNLGSGGMLSRSHSLHQRGQSTSNVVSPQDLLLRKTSDTNKRKRSSWDGGAF